MVETFTIILHLFEHFPMWKGCNTVNNTLLFDYCALFISLSCDCQVQDLQHVNNPNYSRANTDPLLSHWLENWIWSIMIHKSLWHTRVTVWPPCLLMNRPVCNWHIFCRFSLQNRSGTIFQIGPKSLVGIVSFERD